jgi:hypothetical protein
MESFGLIAEPGLPWGKLMKRREFKSLVGALLSRHARRREVTTRD